jgi:hypothetical protein
MSMSQSLVFCFVFLSSCRSSNHFAANYKDKKKIIEQADIFLVSGLYTITKYQSNRSKGTVNDFFSEGDYWWPDPENPNGPYIRKDGMTNPDNFNFHRHELRAFNEAISYLGSAYLLTKDTKYLKKLEAQLNSFFINPSTKMNPSLLYAQAIFGLYSGRGIGIIDTIHLIETAQVLIKLKSHLDKPTYNNTVKWFEEYTTWMTSHQYGLDEKMNGNNHSTWWAAQVMAFATLTQNVLHYQEAEEMYKDLLDKQLATNGSFPEETKRSKPYNYSLFNLEGFTLMCIISELNPTHINLWNYNSKNGSIAKAWHYMTPYIIDKSTWPFPPDVQYYDDLPIVSIGMQAAASKYGNKALLSKLKTLKDRSKSNDEVKRNFPLINKIIWQ